MLKAMQIYYVVNARLPTEKAHGYQILQVCQGFLECGVHVKLLYPDRDNYLEDHGDVNLASYYNLRKEVASKKIPCIDLLRKYHINIPGLHYIHQNFSYYLQLLTFGRNAARVLRRLYGDTNNEFYVYMRDPALARLFLRILPTSMHGRIVLEVHKLKSQHRQRRRDALWFNRFGAVVSLTGIMRNQLLELGMDAKKVFVAPDAVDIESFDVALDRNSARDKLGLPKDRRIAAYIGKFHTMNIEKGIDDIIRSAKYLLNEFKDLDFYFIGGPVSHISKYLQLIEEEGLLKDRFVFYDKQPIQDVPIFLKASDILLMPFPKGLHFENYMSPLKMFEYMSACKPIISTSLPTIKEVLVHGENALLATPGDPESIAMNIRQLLTDTDLGQQIANKAYQDVGKYTWRKRSQGILSFLQALHGS